MKIAFDLRRIGNPGIGRYMKCLAEAVITQAPENTYLLILPPGAEDLIADRAGVEKISPRLKYYSVREQFALPRILRFWGNHVRQRARRRARLGKVE